MKISKEVIQQQRKKMSPNELQEHLKNVKQGVGVRRNKKRYTRKTKYKGSYS